MLTSAKIPHEKMVYITGQDVKNKKPDPELFLRAAAEMNIQPGNCVVIEDAPNGVEAAKRAASKCIAVTTTAGAEALAGADLVVSSLKGIGCKQVVSLINKD